MAEPAYVLVIDDRPETVVVTRPSPGPVVVRSPRTPAGVAVVLTQGRKGDQGPVGPSAYEGAVALGYEGTEQQYQDMIRGWFLADAPGEEPPAGTIDRTWVFDRVP